MGGDEGAAGEAVVPVRRSTRATSGTPAPITAAPIVKKARQLKAKPEPYGELMEQDEEEETLAPRSPRKRGRPQSPKKGRK